MTELQKQRAQTILAQRKELEENHIIDLILDFWEEVNFCYKQKINNIVRICWQKQDTQYECFIADENRETVTTLNQCAAGEERLRKLLFEISKIKSQKIWEKREEFIKLGFELNADEDIMIMSLPEE